LESWFENKPSGNPGLRICVGSNLRLVPNVSYKASAVKIYSATNSMARFLNKNYFSLT
jgi:hypothetical protein